MRTWAWLLLVPSVACNQSDFGYGDPLTPPPLRPPGTKAWGATDVSCSGDDDCNPGEVCEDQVCRMQRCSEGPYDSNAPLGDHRYFFHDRELVAADTVTYQGQYYVDGYKPGSNYITYDGGGSWPYGSSTVTDVAGGAFLSRRPEVVAALVGGTVNIVGKGVVNVGFTPRAIAAGDVDRDGLDELVAISSSGQMAVCDVDRNTCRTSSHSGIEGIDATVGDIDGDGFGEAVFLVVWGDQHELRVWNLDAATTGQDEWLKVVSGRDLVRVAAGDLDDDHRAEVVALEEGGWADFAKDELVVFGFVAGGAELGSTEVDADSKDLTVADLDMDRKDEVSLLYDTNTVQVLRTAGQGRLSGVFTDSLVASSAPNRIAAVDFDGDSPAGRLLDGPRLVPGKVVPSMVLHIPPYWRSHSFGVPYIDVGNAQSQSATLSEMVALRASVTVGYEAEFPAIASASVEATLGVELSATRSEEREITVGNRVWVDAAPELYGDDYAVVLLSCGCYHEYTYEMEDPAGKMGGSGEKFVVLMPVGGQTTVWSSKRYNAMAAAVGDLPMVDVPYRVGDPTSYPTSVTVPAEELVFPDPPVFRASDVSNIGWWLNVNETVTNEVNLQTNVDVAASVEVVGFSVGGSVGGGFGKGYAVAIGEQADFIGGVPPLPDDPKTPEDEYAQYAYSFRPVVMKKHYSTDDGEGGYYVLTFAVGP